jgi:hypothetical protein
MSRIDKIWTDLMMIRTIWIDLNSSDFLEFNSTSLNFILYYLGEISLVELNWVECSEIAL